VSVQLVLESVVHLEMHLANPLVLTHNAGVKIFQHVVDLLVEPGHLGKHVMVLIHVERALHLSIVINRVCVHEFLNLIFQKMSQVKS
jgi:hypothetical protein